MMVGMSFPIVGERSANGREAYVFESWGPVENYPAGIVLFRQGESPEVVYGIEQGWVKLVRIEEDGQAMIVGVRSRGWILGAASALAQKAHAVTAETVTWCRLRRMKVEAFRHLVQRDEAFSWYVHQMHAREVYRQLEQVAGLGCQRARRRLEHLLRELAEEQGGGRVRCPLRQWELAQVVAVTPSYLSQLLGELEREGVLRRENGWIVIEGTGSR
jgi:CRP/FNR family transcriptional regulator